MMEKRLFRRQTLDELENPSQIQEFVRVTRPPFYLVLSALLLCCVVVTLWCIFGTLTDHIKTTAVVFPHGKMQRLAVPYDGLVSEVITNSGAGVHKGDALMVLHGENGHDTIFARTSGMLLGVKQEGSRFQAYDGLGYLVPKSPTDINTDLLTFVEYNDLRHLQVGQEVQVTPSDLHREDYGYIIGRIVSISTYPSHRRELELDARISNFIAHIFPGESAYMIGIKLEQNPDKSGRLLWSREKSADIKVDELSFCNVQIITGRKPVYKLFLRF